MKKLLFTFILLFCLMNNVFSLEIGSTHAILYNLNEDKVIYEKNSNEKISIASLTKIMTTIVAIENIDNLDEKITIKTRDFVTLYENDASLAGFRVGQEVTYRDLLYGTFLPSGAEATQALAFNLTGSIESFVELMNLKAKELGMKDTHFSNTTGLDDEENYASLEDVAILLKYALLNDTFYEIYTANSYNISDGSGTFYSSFRYTASLYNYQVDYIIGAKTGYTDDAGKCLASTANDQKNNISYLLITCGANTSREDAYHIKDTTNIYTYYFNNYRYQPIINKGDFLVDIKAKYGKEKYVSFFAKENLTYYLKNDYDKNKIKILYNGINEIDYNTPKGEKLGNITIYYDNEEILKEDIILKDEYSFSIPVFLLETKIIYIILTIIIIFIFLIIRKIKKLKSKY